jgi:hypothetical protein
MKRVLGILLALTLVVGLSAVPSFSSPQPRQDEKKEKGEKGEKKKGEKGEKKKGEGKKKGEKKDDAK